jgi:hypothetical protein
MPMLRRVLLTAATFLSGAVPAVAQTTAAAPPDSGPSLLWVWAWILVAGILIFIVGTSMGVRRR